MSEYIDHDGGEMPVALGTIIDIKYRNGDENLHVAAGVQNNAGGSKWMFNAYWWLHEKEEPNDYDIVSYRLHEATTS